MGEICCVLGATRAGGARGAIPDLIRCFRSKFGKVLFVLFVFDGNQKSVQELPGIHIHTVELRRTELQMLRLLYM
jgi:hypothetical protein